MATEPLPRDERPAQIRVVSRTYCGDATPLAEVLVLLWDRRQARLRREAVGEPATAYVQCREPTDTRTVHD